ncbi:MAG TPA: hypothetical protein VGL82_11880, partial [Bryobacteraceae bacterium]
LAGSLDVLLRPGLPVRIPDAVYVEATRVHGGKSGDRLSVALRIHRSPCRGLRRGWPQTAALSLSRLGLEQLFATGVHRAQGA